MSKRIIKALVFVLVACMILPSCLVGCAGGGKTLLSIENHKLSANLYQLMLTQQKGMMAYSIYSQYGNYNSENFWGMTIDFETQKTNAEYYDELVLERAKNYISAMVIFDELEKTKADFNFPKSYEKNIDAAIQNMIDVDAGGSKTNLNSKLSEYGININMLREYLIMDAKSNYVMDYLFGGDGSKIGEDVKKAYYEKYYVSCRKIIIQKFYYVYETDEDGTEIYYSTEDGKPIYDTTKTPKFNADGTTVRDTNQKTIYFDENGKIAYDKVNGVRKILQDEKTQASVTKFYSDETINSLREKAKSIAASADGKGLNHFEALRIENCDEYSIDDETNGNMFFDVNVNFSSYTSKLFDDIADSLQDMSNDDVKLFEDDLNFTIVIKTKLEPDAWNDEKYEGFFKDEIYGMTDFITNLKVKLYDDRLSPYREKVEVDKSVLESLNFSISTVAPNYYYPDVDVAYYLYNEEE